MTHITTFVYDELNRKTKTVDALNGTTTVVYDLADNVVNVIDPVGNKTTFVYDAANRQTQEIDPLGNGATVAYDTANRKTSATDRLGRRQDFTYDAANRLTGVVWKAAGGATNDTLTFVYDAASNLTSAANGNGTYTLAYDAVNRVTNVNEPFSQTLTFTYDAVGNRTLVQDSKSGVTTSVYDAANRLTSRQFGGPGQTPLREDFTYTVRDQVATQLRYSDLTATTKIGESAFTYDDAMRLTNLQHKNGAGTVLANYTYTYDTAHRLLTEVLNGTTTTYQYDITNQLTNDTANSYSYDANGNRTMSGYTTGTGNQLTNDGTWTYTYDAEGNLTKKSKGASLETWTYGYDNTNHMTWAEKRATDGGTLQMRADYKYDVFGNRIEKAVDADGAGAGGTTTTRFILDGWKVQQDALGQQPQRIGNEAWDVWADLDGSNTLVTRYIRGDQVDELFARISAAGTAAWYLSDRLGSVRDLVDGSGAVQDHLDFDGFGRVISESNASFGDRWKWTGRESDSETGLQYNRARYYDAVAGRWTTRDPIGFGAGDGNWYRYASNCTQMLQDPSGHEIRLVSDDTTLPDLPTGGSPPTAPQSPSFTDYLWLVSIAPRIYAAIAWEDTLGGGTAIGVNMDIGGGIAGGGGGFSTGGVGIQILLNPCFVGDPIQFYPFWNTPGPAMSLPGLPPKPFGSIDIGIVVVTGVNNPSSYSGSSITGQVGLGPFYVGGGSSAGTGGTGPSSVGGGISLPVFGIQNPPVTITGGSSISGRINSLWGG